jgi:Fe-S-cluster containining protein
MESLAVFYLIVALISIYFLFIRQFVLKRHKFQCLRCGNCCKLHVKLNKEDIEKMKKAGLKDFIEGNNWLKRINGNCKYLQMKNGVAGCSIDKVKPKICRTFPNCGFSVDTRCKFFDKKVW